MSLPGSAEYPITRAASVSRRQAPNHLPDKRKVREMTTSHSIDQHPDVLALRAGYERAAKSMATQGTFGLLLLTAAYAALSPWIVGFNGSAPRLTVNDLIVGLTVAVLAVGFPSVLDRAHGMTWTLPAFGVWTIICPWILRGLTPTGGMIWSNVVSGALIAAFGVAACYFTLYARDLEPR